MRFSTGGAQSQGGSAGGNYQQYMSYQKCMQGAGQKSTQLAASTDDAKASPAAAQGGDYQLYMDYSKYTQGVSTGGAQSQGGSAGGDYQQYAYY